MNYSPIPARTAAGVPVAALRGARVNVGPGERVASIAGGALLTLAGLRRGGFGGGIAALAGGALVARGSTGHCSIYSRLGANPGERQIARERHWSTSAAVAHSVTVSRPRGEVFAFWRDLSNLPRVMRHIQGIEVLDPRRSRWTLRAPAGFTVQWEATLVEERENELLVWESTPGSALHSSARLEFADAPGDRGTEVRALVAYEPPAGQPGRWVAKLFGEEPGQQAREDLARFKQVMETGEITTNAMRPA